MFTTGTKLLIGGAVARHRRRGRLRHHPGGLARHHRADHRRRSPWPSSPASTSTPATPTSRRWTRRRSPSRPPPRRRPGASLWPLVAAVGGVLVVVGLVTYPVVFVFGIIVLLAAAVEWMVAGVERAGVGRRRVTTPTSASASPTRSSSRSSPPSASAIIVYSFSRIMLFLSKTSGPARVRASSPRSSSSSASSSPSGRRSAPAPIAGVAVDRRARARRRRCRRRRSTASARSSRTRRPATLAAEGECDTAEETEADENASQNVAAKANVTAEITLRDDGTLVAQQPRASTGDDRRRRRHPLQPDQRAVPQRDRRGAPARARPRHPARRSTRPATRSPTPRSRTSVCTHARRGGRQPVPDVLDRHAEPRRRRRRTASSSRRRRRRASRWSCRERAQDERPGRRDGTVGARAPPPCSTAARSRCSPALGLLVAGCAKDAPQDTWQPAGAERPEDPEPAVAGVRHRRRRRR